MPQIMRCIVEIMDVRRRDTLFVEFAGLHAFDLDDDAHSRADAARLRHFEWLEAHGVTWETAAPRGWLEGDPGIYMLHVEPDDPRVAAYAAKFETAEGRSLDPEAYQVVVLIFADWLRAQASRTDS